MPPPPRSPQRSQPRQPRLHPFDVQLQPCVACEPVVLRTARAADRATLAFHAEWQRLTEQQIAGELVLVYHDEEPRTLLRESLR